MSQNKIPLKFFILATLAMIAAGLLAGCGGPAPTPPAAHVQPTSANVAVVPDPTAATPPTAVPTPILLAPDDGCVECHNDQEKLVETAKEEEQAEGLSEGEG